MVLHIIYLLLFLLAAVLFFLAMIGVPESKRFHLIAGGLLAWELVYLIKQIVNLPG